MKKYCLSLLLSGFVSIVCAQDTKPFTPTGDATYFNFWEGLWYVIKEDNSLDSNAWFKVTRNVNEASFLEEWKFSEGMRSTALRAWDKTNNKWGFVWISDNGLYQVWDTKKVDGNWYIYRQFTIIMILISQDKALFRNPMEPCCASVKKVMMKRNGN